MTTFGLNIVAPKIADSTKMARAADAAGFDAVWGGEFYFTSASVKLGAWAQATERALVGSSIMYGVGRSPLVLAAEARDIDELSDGRFVLGIGNGTRRMLADWHGVDPSSPAVRIEELVPLVRRLLRLHERPVQHEGRFYRVDMSATAPAPPPVRDSIPIYIAGARPRMIESAGRVADGLLGHALFSPRYIDEVVKPAIARGADHAERSPDEVSLVSMVITAISDDEEQARRDAALQIAFYSSVGSYQQLLDLSGFEREGEVIRSAFRNQDFAAMLEAVSDRMIDEIAVAGKPADVAGRLARYSDRSDHVMLYPPSVGVDPDRVVDYTTAIIRGHAARAEVSA